MKVKRDRKGRFVRRTCDLCGRPTRYVGYNRLVKSRLPNGLVGDYTDFQCGVFCKQHGKEWYAARRAEHSYSHRLIWI